MNEYLQRLYEMIRPRDVQQAATSPLTIPQIGMINRMLGLAQGQAQTAIEQTPQKLAESRALLAEYDPKQPINPKLLDQFMNLAGWGQMGITAYHGSPYLFRMFDPAKRGTGEGEQAYGVGAGYTAAERPVAETYIKNRPEVVARFNKISPETIEGMATRLRYFYGDDAEAIAKDIKSRSQFTGVPKEQLEKEIKKSGENFKSVMQSSGYLYKGDIPDEILPKFLNWDAPIKDQSKEVQSLAKQYGIDSNDLGGDLVARVGKTVEGSSIMEAAGIRGIKYLDANSRNAKFGSQNFIPFRPEDYKIQEINDIPIEDYIKQGLL